jgi:hypothetical protein
MSIINLYPRHSQANHITGYNITIEGDKKSDIFTISVNIDIVSDLVSLVKNGNIQITKKTIKYKDTAMIVLLIFPFSGSESFGNTEKHSKMQYIISITINIVINVSSTFLNA